jgi:hypothetical protein
MSIPITARSSETPSRLRVVDAHGVKSLRHIIMFPRAACPVSGNPIIGAMVVRYTAQVAIEVVTLRDAVAFSASRHPDAPRSVEQLVSWLADEAGRAVGSPVEVEAWMLVRPGPQLLIVKG